VTFDAVNIDTYTLKNYLDENIFDGQYSSDISITELKKYYADLIKGQTIDIFRNNHDDLIIGKYLKWDSDHFGFNCYRFEYIKLFSDKLNETEIYNFLKIRKIKLAFLRVNANAQLNSLLPKKIRLVSTKLMYKLFLTNKHKHISKYIFTIDDFDNGDKKNILDIITSSTINLFKYNRFVYDFKINRDKATNLYQKWIINSATNNKNTFFILINDIGDICAFCIVSMIKIYKHHVARIDIVGSIEAGKNYGTIILKDVVAILKKKRINILYANVDSHNNIAKKLYTKNGFIPYNTICEYHYWL
jgi:hypothetical protein